MTPEAEGLHVLETTLPSSFGDRPDVIGIPEGMAGLDLEKAPEIPDRFRVAQPDEELAKQAQAFLEVPAFQAATGAAASIAFPDQIAQEGGIGFHLPPLDAEVAAEGSSPLGHFLAAVPAESASLRSPGKSGRVDPACLRMDSVRAHGILLLTALPYFGREADMGSYRKTIDNSADNMDITLSRGRDRMKYGITLNGEQELTDDLGAFF